MPRKMREALCQNPDHDDVHPGVSRLYLRSPGERRPSKHCSEECRSHVRHYFRVNDRGMYVRISHTRGNEDHLFTTSLDSVDWNIDMDGSAGSGRHTNGGATVRTNHSAHISGHPQGDNTVSDSREYPLDSVGYPGLNVRFTYYRAINAAFLPIDPERVYDFEGEVTDADLYGDGVDVQIVRRKDNAIMSKAHPRAAELKAMLTSSEWQDRYHTWLNGLRTARDLGILDGTAPVLPASQTVAL